MAQLPDSSVLAYDFYATCPTQGTRLNLKPSVYNSVGPFIMDGRHGCRIEASGLDQ